MPPRTSKSGLKLKVLNVLVKSLPILPWVLLVVGCLLLAALPAADTRVNVQDEGNLRGRGFRSKVEEEDLGIGRDALSAIPSAYMRSVVLDESSTVDIIEVPGSRAPGTEHFVIISTGPSHDVAMALAHSFAHQPFMSMDLRFYLAPPSVDVDAVIQAAGLPVGMLRGGLQLNLSSPPAGISSICVHSFGVGGLQPNQDLLNVFTTGLQVHGLASNFLCHSDADTAVFSTSIMAWDEWIVEAALSILRGGGVPLPLQQWLSGALQAHMVGPLSVGIHEGFEAIGGSPRRAGNMKQRVSHMMQYGFEMLRNGRIGRYGGGRLRTSFGLHTLGISDFGVDAAPTPNIQSSLRVARGVEYGIRSINNLDERLHHSSPAWLSSSSKTFSDFSVGQAVSFLFTAGCIAVLLGTVLQVPVGDLPTSLLHGILSMITAIAAVEWVCTDHELTPVLWSLCTTTIYIAIHKLVGVITTKSARLTTTRHFPLLIVLAMLCTSLVFMLVGLHPVLSMVGGGVLLGQILLYVCVSQGGVVVTQHNYQTSNIGLKATRVIIRGLLSLCISAISIMIALVMAVLVDGDNGIVTQIFIILSTQLAIVTCFATFL